jgi:HEAT repeat protein
MFVRPQLNALGKILSKLAVEALVAVLADPQSSIRNATAGTLRQIRSRMGPFRTLRAGQSRR